MQDCTNEVRVKVLSSRSSHRAQICKHRVLAKPKTLNLQAWQDLQHFKTPKPKRSETSIKTLIGGPKR